MAEGKILVNIYTNVYQNKKEMQITITVLISATGGMIVDGIYNDLLPLPISLPSVSN